MTYIDALVFVIAVITITGLLVYGRKIFAGIAILLFLFWNVSFVPVTTTASLFSFKDFITALALLVIIYTISDVRYHFRVSVSPIPLLKISYVFIYFIGFGTLATDIWISENWLVPDSFITTAIWQGTLAALFICLVITWMHYAFINPPIFGRNNYKQYAEELFRIVQKGSETELPIIASELRLTAKSLVSSAADLKKVDAEAQGEIEPCVEGYAHDMLLLIANRKFCRYLVASSPVTVIRFLEAVSETKAYHVPIGLFAQNVSAEAIQNKDSSLYHEDEFYRSGLLGHIKPFSHALYGNYELMEALRNNSPLDIHYKLVWAWDAEQFEVYCRVAQMTLKSYLEGGHWNQRPYVLNRALNNIQETASRSIMDIKNLGEDYLGDAWDRLRIGVEFIKDCINAIDELDHTPEGRTLRIHKEGLHVLRNVDLYDRLADEMCKIIVSASYIDEPSFKTWSIQHNSVWSNFFENYDNGRAWKIVQFKLRRLLYNHVLELESFPNYGAAGVLGICLNVMGLKAGKRKDYGREYFALKAAVLAWTEKNYLRLREVNTNIADACLIGRITFDAEQSRLVDTQMQGLEPEPKREYLSLQAKT